MKVYEYRNPVLLDLVINRIMGKLNAFPWLNTAYGLVEKQETKTGFEFPAYRNYNSDYIDLTPNDNYYNYCFFETSGEITNLTEYVTERNKLSTDLSIIFYVNLRKIYTKEEGTIYNLISELVTFFDTLNLKNVSFDYKTIETEFNDIFSEYSFEKTDKQYSRFPYYPIKITGEAIFSNICV